MSDLDDWMTSTEAQRALGRSERALRRYVQQDMLRSRLGPSGRILYHRQDVAQLASKLQPDRPRLPDPQIMPAGQALTLIQELQRAIAEAAAREGYLRSQLDQRPRLEDHQQIAEQLAAERAELAGLRAQLAEAQQSGSTWRRMALLGLGLAAVALLILLVIVLAGQIGR